MTRRAWLLTGIGAAATVAGAGAAWWRQRLATDAGSLGSSAASDSSGLWSQRFQQPDGGELVMASRMGRPLLLNFWATWCPPCVKEMPALDRFARTFGDQGWQVVGLAVDGPTPVREFLARTPVGYAIGLAGFEGSALGKALGNSTGGLPFTVAFDARGRVVERKLGESSFDELALWAKRLRDSK